MSDSEAKPRRRRAFGATRYGGPIVLVLMGLIWGITFSFAKMSTNAGVHPLALAFWHAFGGGAFLVLVGLLRGKVPPLNRSALTFYFLCAGIGVILPDIALFYSTAALPSGIVAITVAMVPLATYAFSALLGSETFDNRRVVGLILGLGAIALLALPETSLPDPSMGPWVLLAAVAAMGYAAQNVFIDLKAPHEVDPVPLTGAMLLAGSLILGPIMVVSDALLLPSFPFGPLEWVVTAMFVSSAVAYALFFYMVRVAGPVYTSQTGYIIPLCGVLWGMALLGEVHSRWIWGALLLMFFGLSLVKPRED